MEPVGKRLKWYSPWLIRRCVGARTLACGCVVGVYEMFNGRIVWVIDDRAAPCEEHVPGGAFSIAS
jgi:hypothetical protein